MACPPSRHMGVLSPQDVASMQQENKTNTMPNDNIENVTTARVQARKIARRLESNIISVILGNKEMLKALQDAEDMEYKARTIRDDVTQDVYAKFGFKVL
jgi:regulator of sirC expression with transglutaminase-like and TPR domain